MVLERAKVLMASSGPLLKCPDGLQLGVAVCLDSASPLNAQVAVDILTSQFRDTLVSKAWREGFDDVTGVSGEGGHWLPPSDGDVVPGDCDGTKFFLRLELTYSSQAIFLLAVVRSCSTDYLPMLLIKNIVILGHSTLYSPG